MKFHLNCIQKYVCPFEYHLILRHLTFSYLVTWKSKWKRKSLIILHFEIKETTFKFGYFRTNSGPFFIQLHRYFTKLKCWCHFEVLNSSKTQLNQKLQHKTQILYSNFYSILEEKILKIYDSFWLFFANHMIFSTKVGSSHFEMFSMFKYLLNQELTHNIG